MNEPLDNSIPPQLDRGLAAAFRSRAADRGTDPSVIDRLQARSSVRLGVDLPSPPSPGLHSRGPVDGEANPSTTRYEISAELARGGVGIVYRGRDRDLGRDVAIKVLHPDHADRDDVLERFVEEAQIGGQLQHPGIVPVYELGLQHDQHPFFAMKLVEGETLAVLLRKRTDPDSSRHRLLLVFEQVCQTLAYAHARGVVHRDLKPANVMVGSFGEVQVVDWGLAKVLARGGEAGPPRKPPAAPNAVATARSASGTESMAGAVLGTPAYMAPEQARGDVEAMDQRSDVFALGALLCEILTGAPPYEGSRTDILRQAIACANEPALARLETAGVDTALVSLVADCLAATPASRPSTAGAVAARLGAYLASVEQRARASEIRSAQHALRVRVVTVAAAAVVTVVSIGAAGAIWWRDRVVRQQRAAAHDVAVALDEARTRHGMAQALLAADRASAEGLGRYAEAIAATERALALAQAGDAALRLEVDAMRTVLKDQRRSAENTARGVRRDRALTAALEEARIAPDDDVGDPAFRQREASRRDAGYAAVFRAHGVDVDAMEPEAAAQALRGSADVEVAAALDDWGIQRRLLDQWRTPSAAGTARHLFAVARVLDGGEPWRRRLHDELAREQPRLATLRALRDEIESRDAPATSYLLLADALWSAGANQRAMTLLDAGQRRYPASFPLTFWLGFRHEQVGQHEVALRHYATARALQPENREVWHRIGNVLDAQGQFVEAVNAFEHLVEREPDNPHWIWHRGKLCEKQGKPAEAAAAYRLALDRDPDNALVHGALGRLRFEQGQLDEARTHYERAIALDAGNAATTHYNLGVLNARQGQLDEALRCYRRALEIDPDYVRAHENRGVALASQGKLDEALAAQRKALLLDPQRAAAHFNLGLLLTRLGRRDEAIPSFRRAIEIEPDRALFHYQLGNALLSARFYREASAAFRAATRLDAEYPEAHCNLGHALGGLLTDTTAAADRRALYDEAIESLRRGHELGTARAGWRYPSGEWLRRMQESAAEERRLLQLAAGVVTSHEARDWARAAHVLSDHGAPLAAVRAYERAAALDPELAGDVDGDHRYAAARAAVSAATDLLAAARTDAEERARLHARAHAWLRADLQHWQRAAEQGSGEAARGALEYWLADDAFDRVREAAALDTLPTETGEAWRRFWAEVSKTLDGMDA